MSSESALPTESPRNGKVSEEDSLHSLNDVPGMQGLVGESECARPQVVTL